MYLPFRRNNSDDNCPGATNCSPTYAIIGQDPSEKENDTSFGPSDYGKPGPHRFIGIGMVAGMIFLALVAYIAFAKRPRRMLKRCCCGRRKDESVMVERVAVVLEPSSSSLSSEEKSHLQGMQSRPSENTTHTRRSSSRSKSRKGSRHRTADGVVHVAKDNEQDDAEPGELTRWEVEHVRGVRYEVRTPNDDQPNQRLEVHIQKPGLAYQR